MSPYRQWEVTGDAGATQLRRIEVHTFDGSEDPLSEGGLWLGGLTHGVDWNDCRKVSGLACGKWTTQAQYRDPFALRNGVWAPDQEAEAVLSGVGAVSSGCFPEFECWTRAAVSAGSATAYEAGIHANGDYAFIARWNGPPGLPDGFDILVSMGALALANGDVMRFRSVGNTHTLYLNDVELLEAVDSTHTSGLLGMGFYLEGAGACFGANETAFGFPRWTGRDL